MKPLADFAEAYFASLENCHRRRRSPRTVTSERSKCETLKKLWPGFTKVPLYRLDEEDVIDLCECVARARIDDEHNPRDGEHYKAGAYNGYVGVGVRILKFVGGPPLHLLSERRLKRLLAEIDWKELDLDPTVLPTREQERQMMEYIERRCLNGGRRRFESLIMVSLLLAYGVRKGMIRVIKVSDIDRERGRIWLTFNKKRGGKYVRLDFVLPPLLKQRIEEFIDRYG